MRGGNALRENGFGLQDQKSWCDRCIVCLGPRYVVMLTDHERDAVPGLYFKSSKAFDVGGKQDISWL